MGRTYAGILGSLALVTIVLRGVKNGSGPEAVLLAAWCGLLAFAAIGFLLGELARWIVEDSVRAKFHAKLIAAEGNQRGTDENSPA